MSRAYRIRVSESITRTIHVSDGISFRLELLGVLCGPATVIVACARKPMATGSPVSSSSLL